VLKAGTASASAKVSHAPTIPKPNSPPVVKPKATPLAVDSTLSSSSLFRPLQMLQTSAGNTNENLCPRHAAHLGHSVPAPLSHPSQHVSSQPLMAPAGGDAAGHKRPKNPRSALKARSLNQALKASSPPNALHAAASVSATAPVSVVAVATNTSDGIKALNSQAQREKEQHERVLEERERGQLRELEWERERERGRVLESERELAFAKILQWERDLERELWLLLLEQERELVAQGRRRDRHRRSRDRSHRSSRAARERTGGLRDVVVPAQHALSGQVSAGAGAGAGAGSGGAGPAWSFGTGAHHSTDSALADLAGVSIRPAFAQQHLAHYTSSSQQRTHV
jgi:hypothetical protein